MKKFFMAVLAVSVAFNIALMTAFAVKRISADPVRFSFFHDLFRPKPTLQVTYGSAPSQGIDVFIPDGPGPHPIVVLIHGGCWSNSWMGREQLRHLGPEMTRRGIAVWSIGYRRANEAGGGYPGTYQDVSVALDRLAEDATVYQFDLSRAVLVGHSAGGHLALWAVSRGSLPVESPLRTAPRFVPRSVISLGGIGDLAAFARLVPLLCGNGIFERLAPPNNLEEVSPAALSPSAGSVIMVSGMLDQITPPYAARHYDHALRARKAGLARLIDIPDAGHMDLVTPSTPAWEEVRRLIDEGLMTRH